MNIGAKVVCIDSSVKEEFILQRSLFFRQWEEKRDEYTVRVLFDDLVKVY